MEIIDTISNKPDVSVFMAAYNHEAYIAQALDSILSQKFSGTYEICISDDCSKDNTCGIVKEYQSKYPNIHLNENKTNIGLSKNVYTVKTMCQGKYLINLSGDDYWIDDDKMQRQYDFMESHPDYLAVGTAIQVRADNETTPINVVPEQKYLGKDFTLEMFLEGHNMPTHGIMMKNVYHDPELKDLFAIMPKMSPYIDDITDELLIHMCGKAYIMPEETMVYRVRRQTKNDNNFGSINKGMSFFEKHIVLMNNLADYFKEKIDLTNRYTEIIANGYLTAVNGKQLKEFNRICATIPEAYQKRHVKQKSMVLVPGKLVNKLIQRI